jgi:hypothetical protein
MEELSKVLVLDNEAEARLLDAVLSDQGIPHLMRSYHDSAYDGLWQVQHGWGHVEAPLSRHEEIRRIYEELSLPPGDDAGDQDPSGSD